MRRLEIKYITKSVPLLADKKIKVSFMNSDSDDFWLLRGINLDVAQGEAVGIIGENGSGKSELLKIIAGLSRQTTGFITTDAKISYASLRSLDDSLTGLENIRAFVEKAGVDKFKGDHLTNGIIDFTEVGQLLYRPVKDYSVGMYARLALGIALYVEPELVIIDDILTVLDQAFLEKTIKRMQALKDTGVTFIIADVKNAVIESLCERSAWISFGELQDFGPTREIMRQYEYALDWYRALTLPEKNDYLANKQRLQMMFDVRKVYDEFKSDQYQHGYTRKDEPKMRKAFYVEHGADPVAKNTQVEKKPKHKAKKGMKVALIMLLLGVLLGGSWFGLREHYFALPNITWPFFSNKNKEVSKTQKTSQTKTAAKKASSSGLANRSKQSSKASSSSNSSSSASSSSSSEQVQTITVGSGETIGELAEKYNTTVAKIQALNDMGSNIDLTAGATLKVPK